MTAKRFGCVLSLVLAGIPLHAQFAKEARTAVSAALKVSVKPPPQGARAGDPVEIGVQLQNGMSQPATMPKETQVEIQLLGSSGEIVQKGICKINAGVADGKCVIQAPKAGLYKIRARPDNRELLEGTGYVLIRARSSRTKAPGQALIRQERASEERFLLLTVAYQDPGGPVAAGGSAGNCSATRSRSHAKVILTINEGGEAGGAFRASLESATIQAFFEADDGGSAPSNILVWLSPDHGALDHEPLIIPRCSISGEAHLSSKYPVLASVIYTVVPASYAVEAPPTLRASFVRPIIGIGIVPKGTQTLSLIDRGPIVAQFFDLDGNTIPTDSARTVTFVSDNSSISTKQQSVSLKAGDLSAQTEILPFWLGTGSIFVTTDRLKSPDPPHHVEVVGKTVIAVCLLGGLAGGLVLFFVSGGSLYSRLVVGMVAGIVLSWAYVFGLLPKVDGVVAHNYISVFVVSILGGYLGIKTFDLILKRFGWGG
jgi:hypothetical protein